MIGRARHAGARWWPWLALWTAVGLGIRLGTVFGRPNRVAGGDAYYNHNAANLLVAGKGFINPFLYYPHDLHHHVQTASWPPLFVFVLAAASLVGAKSFLAQRIWCCIIGAGGVVLCGYVGREIGGRRVGLIAALLVAVYPNIWMSDELVLSETLSPVLVALVLLTAYRFWKRPGTWNVVWLGAVHRFGRPRPRRALSARGVHPRPARPTGQDSDMVAPDRARRDRRPRGAAPRRPLGRLQHEPFQ